MVTTASAPGKVILFGEHAIVYPGHVGLATAINRRVYTSVEKNNQNYVNIYTEIKGVESPIQVYEFELKDLLRDFKENFYREQRNIDGLKGLNDKYKPLAPVKLILAELFEKFGFEGLEIKIKSDIPEKSHLGSSSSAFASVAGAAMATLDGKLDVGYASELANHGDVILIGSPSGIDNNVVSYGGWVKYEKIEPKKGKLERLDLSDKFSAVIANSGVESETGRMVAYLKGKLMCDPTVMIFLDKINILCECGLAALKERNLEKVGQFMTKNHNILQRLEISNGELDNLVKIALYSGAYGAKLTGAGGGGCVITLGENLDALVKKFEAAGYEAFITQLGTEGVRLEQHVK